MLGDLEAGLVVSPLFGSADVSFGIFHRGPGDNCYSGTFHLCPLSSSGVYYYFVADTTAANHLYFSMACGSPPGSYCLSVINPPSSSA